MLLLQTHAVQLFSWMTKKRPPGWWNTPPHHQNRSLRRGDNNFYTNHLAPDKPNRYYTQMRGYLMILLNMTLPVNILYNIWCNIQVQPRNTKILQLQMTSPMWKNFEEDIQHVAAALPKQFSPNEARQISTLCPHYSNNMLTIAKTKIRAGKIQEYIQAYNSDTTPKCANTTKPGFECPTMDIKLETTPVAENLRHTHAFHIRRRWWIQQYNTQRTVCSHSTIRYACQSHRWYFPMSKSRWRTTIFNQIRWLQARM